MTRLSEALQALGVQGEMDSSGRWAKLGGERCPVYVVEATYSSSYYTWCDDPEERSVESYLDPTEAIRAGLRRASRGETTSNIVDKPAIEGGGELPGASDHVSE